MKVDLKTPQSCTIGLNCDPNYQNAIQFTKTTGVTLAADVDYFCNNSAFFEWSFFQFDSENKIWIDYFPEMNSANSGKRRTMQTKPESFSGYNMRKITFVSRAFEIGLYEIHLNVSIQGTRLTHFSYNEFCLDEMRKIETISSFMENDIIFF